MEAATLHPLLRALCVQMAHKFVATFYILLGIQILASALPFPDLRHPLVASMPPNWVHWFVILVLPPISIIFGVVTYFNWRRGYWVLGFGYSFGFVRWNICLGNPLTNHLGLLPRYTP